MTQAITHAVLMDQNQSYRGSGGTSAENRSRGFRPAFLDTETRMVHLSRFANGNPAPVHLLDGLPGELVTRRTSSGSIAEVRASVVAGFVRDDCFFSRDEAAQQISSESQDCDMKAA